MGIIFHQFLPYANHIKRYIWNPHFRCDFSFEIFNLIQFNDSENFLGDEVSPLLPRLCTKVQLRLNLKNISSILNSFWIITYLMGEATYRTLSMKSHYYITGPKFFREKSVINQIKCPPLMRIKRQHSRDVLIWKILEMGVFMLRKFIYKKWELSRLSSIEVWWRLESWKTNRSSSRIGQRSAFDRKFDYCVVFRQHQHCKYIWNTYKVMDTILELWFLIEDFR